MRKNSLLKFLLIGLISMPLLLNAEIVARIVSDKKEAFVSEKITVTLTIENEIESIKDLNVSTGYYPNAILSKPLSLEDNSVHNSFGGVLTPPTYRYTFYPQKAGVLHIRPFELSYNEQHLDGTLTNIRVKSDPVDINVSTSPGAPKDVFVLFTSKLRVKSEYKPDKVQLNVGDAVTRTVTITAENVPDVLIGEVNSTLPEVFKGYPSQPILSQEQNQNGDGSYESRRVQEETLVAVRAGTAVIPEQKIYWYDGKKLHVATIPAKHWKVLKGVAAGKKAFSKEDVVKILLWLLFLAFLLYLLYRYRMQIKAYYLKAQKRLYASSLYKRYDLIDKLNPQENEGKK